MTLIEILMAADARLLRMNADSLTATSETRSANSEAWSRLLQAARAELPEALRPFVRASRQTNRDDFPTGISVSIDLPGCERLHFGPWVYDKESDTFRIDAPWRNKPFEVAGGNREEFGDLLDAIARAREIYQTRYEQY
jgi:hypothetical protein